MSTQDTPLTPEQIKNILHKIYRANWVFADIFGMQLLRAKGKYPEAFVSEGFLNELSEFGMQTCGAQIIELEKICAQFGITDFIGAE